MRRRPIGCVTFFLLLAASRTLDALRVPLACRWTRADVCRGFFASIAAGAAASAAPVSAEDSSGALVGQIPASGIIFKDIVKVERIDDPKVQGIELYVSDFQRPITDRLNGDFFSDPAQAAVTCVRTGRVEVSDDVDATLEGEEVFQQARSLLFKSVNVRRLYDREKGIVIYVSYSTRLNKNDDEGKSRFRTAMCAIKVDAERRRAPPPEPPPPAE